MGILRVLVKRLRSLKTLMNAKVDELKLSDISVVRYFIDLFPEELVKTTTIPIEFRIDLCSKATQLRKSRDIVYTTLIEMQELSKHYENGKTRVLYTPSLIFVWSTRVDDALKERMKPRRVRAVAMTIQYGVRGMILAVQSEVSSKRMYSQERLHTWLDRHMERKEDEFCTLRIVY
ncbi:hypothetical protein Tco_1395049 [Tanacetum coccineum]